MQIVLRVKNNIYRLLQVVVSQEVQVLHKRIAEIVQINVVAPYKPNAAGKVNTRAVKRTYPSYLP